MLYLKSALAGIAAVLAAAILTPVPCRSLLADGIQVNGE